MITTVFGRSKTEQLLFCGQIFDRADQIIHEADLPTVRGEFSAVWIENGTIFAARDPLGVVPLYYTYANGTWIFATTLREIASAYPWPLTPNRTYLQGLWWDFYGCLNESPFCEIHRLPAGHVLKIDDKVPVVQRYFRSLPLESYTASTDALANIRTAVDNALAKRAQGQGQIGLFLSGGFDSSVIAKRFQDVVPGNRLNSYSLVFPPGDEAHSPDLESVLKDATWRARTFPFQVQSPELYDADESLYFYSPNLNIYKFLMRHARADGVSRIMTGLGGDDLFTHAPNILAGLVRQGQWRMWSDIVKDRTTGLSLREVVRGTFAPLIPTAVYKVFQKFRVRHKGGVVLTANDEQRLLQKLEIYEQQCRQLDRLPHRRNIYAKFFTSGMAAFAFEQEQEIAQAQGALMSYPLLDVDLIMAVLRTPIELHLEQFFAKGLLRRAMDPVIPDFIKHIHSSQQYNEMVETLMTLQEDKLKERHQWVKSRAILDQCTAIHLSLDEMRFVNYIYKIFHHCEGDRYEQKKSRQKALSKAPTEAIWFS